MPKKKKVKPPPQCRYLWTPITTRGWGNEGLGEADWNTGWNNDPVLNDTSPQSQRHYSPLPTPTTYPPQRTRHPPSFCTLVLSVPPRLGYVAREECCSIWNKNDAFYSGKHKVRQPIKKQEDVRLAAELRSPLGLSVLAKEKEDFFAVDNESAMLSLVQDEPQWIPWTNVLKTWALLADSGRRYDANVDIANWFPPPSFNVRCQTPDGGEIINYDHIVQAFVQGMLQCFPNWAVDPQSALIQVILEIQDPSLIVLVELKPRTLRGPFASPTEPVTEAAVAYTLLRMAEVKEGDVLVNCSCQAVDVIQEMLQTYRSVHAMACDISVIECTTRAAQWGGSGADGISCSSPLLPFRRASIDVIIAVLQAPSRRHPQERSAQLREMERVSRLGTGRVCFLTQSSGVETLLRRRRYWESVSLTETSFDGVRCMLYVLKRNDSTYQTSDHPPPGFGQRQQRLPYDTGQMYDVEMDWTDEI